jgi:hypothetical protein
MIQRLKFYESNKKTSRSYPNKKRETLKGPIHSTKLMEIKAKADTQPKKRETIQNQTKSLTTRKLRLYETTVSLF